MGTGSLRIDGRRFPPPTPRRFLTLGAALALVLAITPLAAQIPGNVDWSVRPGGEGVVFAGEAARGLNYDSGESLFAGVRIASLQERSAVWFGGGYAGMAGAADNAVSLGGGLSYVLASPTGMTLAADGGVGIGRRSGSWDWVVPAGLTLWIDPAPDAAVHPFVSARGFVTGRSGYGEDVGFSAVGGAQVRLPGGPAFHVALEWEIADGQKPLGIGLGMSVGG
ncbi:MAG: hypothetical protein OEZ65_16890 [Gemmatimonadota bacterium]|nr:hypothetical protein [Gemmatimonadota bacterium]